MYINQSIFMVNRHHPLDQKRPLLILICRLYVSSVRLSDEPNEVRHFMLSMGNIIIDYTSFVYHLYSTMKEKQEYTPCILHRFDCSREVNGN